MARGSKKIIHVSFEIGLLIKGIDGIVEILGGFLFLFVSARALHSIVSTVTRHELSEDPNDFIVKLILSLSDRYSVSVQLFSALYLFTHGVIKLFIIYLLRRKKYWAYPVSILVLVLFILYQSYRYLHSHSAFLLLLTLFDGAMICLTYAEYKNMKIENVP